MTHLLRACLVALLLASPARAATSVVISQIYGGGGFSDSVWRNDFVELFNPTALPVSVDGWSVQYGSATGNFTQRANLGSVTLEPGQYYLVQFSGGSDLTAPVLPTADVTSTTNLGVGAGKIALVSANTTLSCGGAAVCSTAQLATIVDLIGYGSPTGSSAFEGVGAAPALSGILGALRGHCFDTNENALDVSAESPLVVRNSASTLAPCPAVPTLGVRPLLLSLTAPAGSAGPVTGLVRVANIGAGGALAFTHQASPSSWLSSAGGNAAPATLTVSATPGNLGSGEHVGAVTISAAGDAATVAVRLDVEQLLYPQDIQGAGHTSTMLNDRVVVRGVVTALESNGFFLQDPIGDGDVRTSDALFAFTGGAPPVVIGHEVIVDGTVTEFRSSTAPPQDSTLTELTGATVLQDLGVGAVVPLVVIATDPSRTGARIRHPPAATWAVAGYDPDVNAVDFYESLESMLVQVDNPRVVAPSDPFGAFPIVPDGGTGVTGLTPRGFVIETLTDKNPERIFVSSDVRSDGNPSVVVGDRLTASVTGPLDYAHGLFRLQSLVRPQVDTSSRATAESLAPLTQPGVLRVAEYSLDNFHRRNTTRVQAAGQHIAQRLGAPDLLLLNEVQDDSGSDDDGTVAATSNVAELAATIAAAGGPSYSATSIDPVDKAEGGLPSANGRTVLLYRTDRGLSLAGGRPVGGSTTSVTWSASTGLSHNPGRLGTASSAFVQANKPLVAQLVFRGRRIVVVGFHFASRAGEPPLYGQMQPPPTDSETLRGAQAQVVRDFATTVLGSDPATVVLVAGNLNAPEQWPSGEVLRSGGNTLAAGLRLAGVQDLLEPYTYVVQGNAEMIDQIFYPVRSASRVAAQDVVHVNTHLALNASGVASDHDPVILDLDLGGQAEVALTKTHAGGPFVATTRRTWTLEVRNAVNADAATGIVVTDTLPAGLTYASASGAGWSCAAQGQVVTCASASALAAGDASTVTLAVDVSGSARGTVVNHATVSAAGDFDPSNDADSDAAEVVLATAALALSASPAALVSGQPVTLTVHAQPVAPAARAPEGQIAFVVDGATEATVTLAAGIAAHPRGGLFAGAHSVLVRYSGGQDADFAAAEASTELRVARAASAVALVASAASTVDGTSVLLTATVSAVAPGQGVATGQVTFKNGSTVLGIADLDGGAASLSTTVLAPGESTLVAEYPGDTELEASVSAPLEHTVTAKGTSGPTRTAEDGCGCGAGGSGPGAWLLVLAGLALRRRRVR